MRRIAKGLVLIALITISVFFGITYYETYVNVPKKETNKNTNVSDTILLENGNNKDKENSDLNNNNFNSFPKNCYETEDFYVNNLGGSQNENLLDYFNIGNWIYVILQTDSQDGDFNTKYQQLAIAKFDDMGNLLATQVLNTQQGEIYLHSTLNENGILVLTSSPTAKLYSISLDLSYKTTSCDFSLENGFVYNNFYNTFICGEINNRLGIYKLVDNKFELSFGKQINYDFVPIELFSINNKHHLFYNDGHCGYVLTFDNFGFKTSVQLTVEPFAQVSPFENGFAISTLLDYQSKFYLFDPDLNQNAKIDLGKCENLSFAVLDNGFFILLSGEIGHAFFVCKHGDVVLQDERSFSLIREVCDIIKKGEKLEIIAKLSHDSFIKYTFDSKTNVIVESKNFYLPSAEKTVVFPVKNRIALFTQTWAKTEIFQKNQGKNEIFLLIFK